MKAIVDCNGSMLYAFGSMLYASMAMRLAMNKNVSNIKRKFKEKYRNTEMAYTNDTNEVFAIVQIILTSHN